MHGTRQELLEQIVLWESRLDGVRRDALLIRPEVREHASTVMDELELRLAHLRETLVDAAAAVPEDEAQAWERARLALRRLETLARWYLCRPRRRTSGPSRPRPARRQVVDVDA